MTICHFYQLDIMWVIVMNSAEKSQLVFAENAYNHAYSYWHDLMQYDINCPQFLQAEQAVMLSRSRLRKAEEEIVSWMMRSIRQNYANDARLAWLDSVPTLMLNKKKRSHLVEMAKKFEPIHQ